MTIWWDTYCDWWLIPSHLPLDLHAFGHSCSADHIGAVLCCLGDVWAALDQDSVLMEILLADLDLLFGGVGFLEIHGRINLALSFLFDLDLVQLKMDLFFSGRGIQLVSI